jgi:hypothetical protein
VNALITRASIFFARSLNMRDGLHRNSGLPEFRSLKRRKSR